MVKSTGMICLFDTFVALLSGLAIFPAVAHFNPALLQGADGAAASGPFLMFDILPRVFASMQGIGQIISFLFFGMVAIAALTSVVSLIEVVTQFIIQRFRISRKHAALGCALVCGLLTIPVGLSFGSLIAGKDGIRVAGMDLLSFLDDVTNAVLMPVCAFFACVAIGWIIGPKRTMDEMEEGATRLGFLRKIYPVMVRFVTPALILIVEIGGVVTKLTDPNGSQWPVIVTAYALLGLVALAYFLFFRNTDTGTNADELALAEARTEDGEAEEGAAE